MLNPKAISWKHKSRQFSAVALLSKPLLSTYRRNGKAIKQAFLDVTMTKRHRGLYDIAMAHGIDPRDLRAGEFLLFINPSGSYIAIIEQGGGLKFINRRYVDTDASIDGLVSEYQMPAEARAFLRKFFERRHL